VEDYDFVGHTDSEEFMAIQANSGRWALSHHIVSIDADERQKVKESDEYGDMALNYYRRQFPMLGQSLHEYLVAGSRKRSSDMVAAF
jgi:hypothetical protein